MEDSGGRGWSWSQIGRSLRMRHDRKVPPILTLHVSYVSVQSTDNTDKKLLIRWHVSRFYLRMYDRCRCVASLGLAVLILARLKVHRYSV